MLLVSGAVVARTSSEHRAELQSARDYRKSGQHTRAVEHYRRALRWSSPLGTRDSEAIAALESIARESEAAGDRAAALLAWRSLVGGLSATRVPYLAQHPARDRAVDEIARLLATDRVPGIDADLGADRLSEDHRRLLASDIAPDPTWGTLLLGGFALWIASLVLATRQAFDSAGRVRWPKMRGPVLGALAGFASFVLGLLFA